MNEDTKIFLVVEYGEYEENGPKIPIVSHGIGNKTMKNYILQHLPLGNYINLVDCQFDDEAQAWFLWRD